MSTVKKGEAKKKMHEKKKKRHIWISFTPEDVTGQKFFKIKHALGIKSSADVIRHLTRTYDLEALVEALMMKKQIVESRVKEETEVDLND